MTSDLECFFYYSRLSPAHDVTCVSNIIKVARSFNSQHGITGVLVFDGESFCQYIEGPRGPLNELIARLLADPRHTDVHVLMHQPLAGPRLYAQWAMAYSMLDGIGFLQQLTVKAPQDALSYLRESEHAFDLG